MAEQVNESVIRKIQLLFQMAARAKGNDGSSNEAEASAAMAKAQELLAKYNLDMATIQDAKVAGGSNTEDNEKREKTRLNRTAMYAWQQRMCKAIAEANFCWYWTRTVVEENKVNHKMCSVKRHVILGREANVTAVTMMYDYLCEVIEGNVPQRGTKDIVSRSANSWREGCADRLVSRINDKQMKMQYEVEQQAKQAASGKAATVGTAITLRSVTDNEYAANYDATYGAGAYARSKATDAEWYAQQAERQQLDEEVKAKLLASETPAQCQAREAAEAKEAEKEAKANERYWQAQDRRKQREADRRDWSAYQAGQAKGSQINLDSQLKGGNPSSNKLKGGK